MKVNTRKLLLLLYELEESKLEYAHLPYLWPELSPGGRRALIFHLQQKQYISVTKYGSQNYLQLTPYGEKEIKRHIPALRSVGESIHCIVLLEAPEFDPGFSRLRRVLKEQGAVTVTPSTYLYRASNSDKVLYLCQDTYFTSVLVFVCGEWEVGNPQFLLQKKSEGKDTLHLLSGISREIDQLIDRKITFSLLNHQSNLLLFSVFERLFIILETVPPIIFSSKNSPLSGGDVLKRLQSLL